MSEVRRWVVKVGSALLTDNGVRLNVEAIAAWSRQIVGLKNAGCDVVVVSSGAVAAGMAALDWVSRPDTVHELQAAAAVGQTRLVGTWEDSFRACSNFRTAQVLVDHDDLSSRERYLNARITLRTLLELGVVPVVNENDTVVTDEIRFGDNDTLAALVANLIGADGLLILTDQDGMYDSDPRTNADAKMLTEVAASDHRLDAMASGGGRLGRGGMTTKVRAARLAARSGVTTIVVGNGESVITRVAAGESLGTLFHADQPPEAARKAWLAGHLQMSGQLELDSGAVNVLRLSGGSLLPVGVKAVSGDFKRGDMVACLDPEGREIAHGLVNYSIEDARQILGKSSAEVAAVLGFYRSEGLIHRDDLVLI